jgi:hypothetical protein
MLISRNIRLFALALVAFAGTYSPGVLYAQQPVTWQLNNVFFSPEDRVGGEWMGSFVFDATTGTITDWNISIPGGVVFPLAVPPYTYTSSSPMAFAEYQLSSPGAAVLRFSNVPFLENGDCDASQPQRCLLIQTAPLPATGGTVVVSLAEEGFTPTPFDTFNRTVDLSKQPELIAIAPPFIATPVVLWPPNRKMVPVTVTVVQPTLSNCRINLVSSNELITAADWHITGDLSVELRAERSRPGSGRAYSLDIDCIGTSGPVSANVTVTVPHDQGKNK